MPLDPTVKALLDQMAEAGAPAMSEQAPEEARAGTEGLAAMGFLPEELKSVADRNIPGPAGEIPIRIYTPEGSGLLPVTVFYHGGGWVVMNVETHDAVCRYLAKASGSVVVSVDYRLAPESKYRVPVEDCFAATAWVAANAADLGVDAARLAVAGDSAGGNLAAAVAQMARDRGGLAVAFQALMFPALDARMDTKSYSANSEGYFLTEDSMQWFWNHYLNDESDGEQPYASPPRGDMAGLPPAFVATAEFDPLRDEGEAYAAALKAAGVQADYINYDGQVHDFILLGAVMPRAKEAMDALASAIKAGLSA